MEREFDLEFTERWSGKVKQKLIRNEEASQCHSYTVGYMLGDVVRNFGSDAVHEALHGIIEGCYVADYHTPQLVEELLKVIQQYREWCDRGAIGEFADVCRKDKEPSNGS
jgi:hypothetical protein